MPQPTGIPCQVSTAIFYTLCTVLFIAPFIILPNTILDGTSDYSNIPKRAFLQLGAILLFLQFIIYRAARNRRFRVNVLDAFVFLFVAWSAVSAIHAHNAYLSQQKLLNFLAAFLMYLVVRFTCQSWSAGKLNVLFAIISIAMSLVSAIGIFQYLFGPGALFAIYPYGSSFGNHPFAAEYLLLFLPFTLISFLNGRSIVAIIIHGIAAAASILYCLYSGCRSAWIGVFLIVVYCGICLIVNPSLIKAFTRTKILITLLAGILSLSMIHFQPKGFPVQVSHYRTMIRRAQAQWTFLARRNVWKNCLAMLEKQPLQGFGLGNFGIFYPAFHQARVKSGFTRNLRFINAHNEFLETAVEQGIPGFIIFSMVLLITMRFAYLLAKREQDGNFNWIGTASFGSLLGFLPMAFFWFPMDNALPPSNLLLITALLSAHAKAGKGMLRIWFPSRFALVSCLAIPLTVYSIWSCSFDYADVRSLIQYSEACKARDRHQIVRALTCARLASIYNPSNLNALHIMGMEYIALHRQDDAIEIYEEIIKYDPYQIFVLDYLADFYRTIGRAREAVDIYFKLMSISPDRSEELVGKISQARSEMKRPPQP